MVWYKDEGKCRFKGFSNGVSTRVKSKRVRENVGEVTPKAEVSGRLL